MTLVRESRDSFPTSFAVTSIGIGVGVTVFAVRRDLFGWLQGSLVLTVLVLLVLGAGRSMRGSLMARSIVEVREGEPFRPGKPIGNAARRLLRTVVPSWSSKATVVVLGTCFALTAALLPVALKLPRFVEVEVVLFAWFLLFWGVLTLLLFRGARLGDDHALRLRAPTFESARLEGRKQDGALESLIHAGREGAGWVALEVEGCALIAAALAIAGVLLGASWLVFELVFPSLFFVLYTVLRGALARVTNDTHDCEQSLVRALKWGLAWSALYTLPVALLVWLFHFGVTVR